ncbi:hypothetical protein, partial [Niastella populi]|uniref:hypothetical protein n=1 Tax=Niastella populi TaxID=550983 RepID=UPI0010552940
MKLGGSRTIFYFNGKTYSGFEIFKIKPFQDMAIFSDMTNKFQIIDFLPTHRQLLVRSLKNQNRDHNIDIIFKVVSTLLIPATFEGLEISIAETDEVVRGLI